MHKAGILILLKIPAFLFLNNAFCLLLAQKLQHGLGNIVGAQTNKLSQTQLAAMLHKVVGQAKALDDERTGGNTPTKSLLEMLPRAPM